MTREERELLFKDLCSRLPYGVKLQKTYDTSDPVELYLIDLGHHTVKFYKYKGEGITICDVGDIERFGQLRFKPYLLPLSSMTKAQKKYIRDNYTLGATHELFDWLNENHFDYRGLIEKGLAIDATGLNIY